MEDLKFDYTVGYNFYTMEKIIKQNTKDDNVSIAKHITDSKESYFNLSSYMLDSMAKCDDPIEIVFLIDKYNRARSAWTHYDMFENEIKLDQSR
ncbi:hypothetical protein NJT12_04890 [Flavobacterium sp. AC]|uniref:Uncharacterized protein n=1 Tax=Flavobacterium azizsancarii TaxID=2961580 RepID=A0ABT4W8T7_9FLAO|nr:hypothetical protein [Flavobacterium azizsancarii]MDA6068953.1 hypothetical protein [Flavobacterium azizsancarii]